MFPRVGFIVTNMRQQTVLAGKLGVAQSYVAKVEGAERRLDVVEFISWLDAANAVEEGVTVLERVRAAQMPNS